MNILIPGYDIEGEIGEGAMASVYLATQRSLERKVALKVISATNCNLEQMVQQGKCLQWRWPAR